jgi:ribosome-binding protein aMBF1 (putative translation factor)
MSVCFTRDMCRIRPDRDLELQWFGQLVYEGRRQKGWTQRELAEALGVHQSTISRIEAGRMPGANLDCCAALLWRLRPLRLT